MQSVTTRIWTRVAVSIFFDDNHYTTGTSLTSFHSNNKRKEERKKQEVTSVMAYLKVQNERECVLYVECWKYRKNWSMSVLRSAIFRSRVSPLVGQGLWHMQISANQNWCKKSNLSIVVVAFVASQ